MPRSSTRSTPYVPQNTRSTHPIRVATGPIPVIAQPLTRREARMLEALAAEAASPPAIGQLAIATVSLDRVTPPEAIPPAFASRRERRTAEATASRPRRTARFALAVPRRHLVLAVSGGLVVAAVAAGASLTFGASPSTETAAADAVAPTATALPAVASARVVLSAVSATSGTVVGGTSVTLSGSNLDTIASVSFGGVAGSVSVANPGEVTITAPPAPDQSEGTVDVAFFDTAGAQITFDAVTDVAASATSGGTPVTASAGTQTASSGATPLATTGTAEADTIDGATAASTAVATTGTTDAETADAGIVDTEPDTSTGPVATTKMIATAIAFSYTPDPAIEAAKAAAALRAEQLDTQLAYVDTYWSDYNSAEYGVISGNDCMNFTSQSLIARGWTMDSEWSYSASGGYSSAWASSTAFANYLASHPERATALSNAQRDQVEVGDVVQFDWDGSGDWDHTGIVTRVDGDAIYYSSHTSDNNDQSIDSASAGRIGFWSIT
ncbi:amidase domain-containing protein [Microbacteriaceae bacterium VKM Ac-2855]|nr:amidase domain-containing protein [Microbacteriaceae bacterium VKM Ac-2855]